MNDPMTLLKAHHREAKRLLTALAESEEGAKRDKMAHELNAALTLHMEIEESIVYPAVKKLVGVEDEEEAEIEHGLAREGLATMMAMLTVPGFGAAVERVKGGITHHVEEEESELLPALKDKMDRGDWLAMGDQIVAAKSAAGAKVPKPAPR